MPQTKALPAVFALWPIFIQEPCQTVGAKIGGRPAGFRRAPLFTCQPAYKPGSGRHAKVFACVTAIPLGPRLPGASSNLPGQPDPDMIPKRVLAHGFAPSLFGLAPGGVCPATDVTVGAVRSYRTISPLPRRSEHAAAVYFLWHCPWVRTRRMLSGTACPRSPDFPPRQPFGFAGAAVRPTDCTRDGDVKGARQGSKMHDRATSLKFREQRAASRSGPEPRSFWDDRGWREAPVKCCASMGRPGHRYVRGGNGVEMPSQPPPCSGRIRRSLPPRSRIRAEICAEPLRPRRGSRKSEPGRNP
jgi:hypothetical protein